jgi:hypothetical protein
VNRKIRPKYETELLVKLRGLEKINLIPHIKHFLGLIPGSIDPNCSFSKWNPQNSERNLLASRILALANAQKKLL